MKQITTRARLLLFIVVLSTTTQGEELVPSLPTTPHPSENNAPAVSTSSAERRTIQQYGLTYILARSTRNDSTETEEYFLQGESAASWSQMITYQRLVLAESLSTAEYVGWLKKHFEKVSGGPRLKVVQQGKAASIFGVHYGKTDTMGEQFGLALVTKADPRRPNELHLVQYAINIDRVSIEQMELQVKRWQALFQSQAASISR